MATLSNVKAFRQLMGCSVGNRKFRSFAPKRWASILSSEPGQGHSDFALMTTRRAACACGQLELSCEGAPRRISMCHCLACQRRTGSVFGVQAWFSPEQITPVAAKSSEFIRIGESGAAVTYRFCPVCGSTVSWEAGARPGLVAVAVGSFADPAFPPPQVALWEKRRHEWVDAPSSLPIERS
jgi:hypothetical protein